MVSDALIKQRKSGSTNSDLSNQSRANSMHPPSQSKSKSKSTSKRGRSMAMANIASFLKQRRASISSISRSSLPQQHHQTHTDSDSSGSGSGRWFRATPATMARALVLAALLIMPMRLLLRSLFPSRKNIPSSSFSALLDYTVEMEEKMHRDGTQYGEIPLTGVHTLGEDHLLENAVASSSKNNPALVTGSIQFPLVDLSTVLKEEAKEISIHQIMMANFAQPVPNQDPGESFLSSGFTFKSAFDRKSQYTGQHGNDDALLTRCGYKMGNTPNQDRSLIAKFDLGAHDGLPRRDKHALLMGIFDGHGPRGHVVSHYIALELPRIFAKIMREKQIGLHQSLIGGFVGSGTIERQVGVVDGIRQVLNETFLELDAHEPLKGTGGSTASTLFYPGLGSIVYIANVGDSTTLLVRYSKSKKTSSIIFQNRKHKPHLEGERKRIENAGGRVMIPPSALQDGGDGIQETSRVVIPDPGGNPFAGLALAMSRSIGDFDGRGVGLIPEPDVIPFDVSEYYKNAPKEEKDDSAWFAVVASDGVYDLLSPESVVEYLGQSLHQDGQINKFSPAEACERIIREASRLWMKASVGGMPYRDDITIGVSTINFILE